MKTIINEKEAKQLSKQGYVVTAGQIVDVAEMPEWIRKRAEFNAKPMIAELIEQRKREDAFREECAKPFTNEQLRGLAKALGRPMPETKELWYKEA